MHRLFLRLLVFYPVPLPSGQLLEDRSMNIYVKKTTQLSVSEQQEILSLFNTVFNKNRKIEFFSNHFFNTIMGYSYHSVLYDNSKIVGCFSFIPSYYRVESKTYLAALGVDLMIERKYQGQGYFYDMFSECINYMQKDGVVFIILFPNNVSYPGYIQSKLVQEIGRLTVYALPYRIGGIKSELNAFNWLSIFLSNMFVFFSLLFAGKEKHVFSIEKDVCTYNQTRYNQTDGGYIIEQQKDCGFVYKIMEYEGVRAVFLIDVFTKSARNFISAIKYIINNHKKEFDIILYIGYLPYSCHGFIKVPQCFSSKIFYFMGKLLQKNVIDMNLFANIKNWDVNLSNYDLL